MRKLCPSAVLSLLGAVFSLATTSAAPQPFALLHSLFDPGTNAQIGAQQGQSVAIDGNLAVVGAPFDDVGAEDSGVVKVYDATTGALLHTLLNPSPAVSDNFGHSVAISGMRIVVGAYLDDRVTEDGGIAYVYDLAGTTPVVPALTLINPDSLGSDNYGTAVAISGSRILIGAPAASDGETYVGTVFVYDLDTVDPALPVAVLINPLWPDGDNFGRAVAISGTRVVVGGDGFANGIGVVGSAVVYDLASATPNLPFLTLTNPAPALRDEFGAAVAISGTRVVVGAPFDDSDGSDTGIVYVYELTDATPEVPVFTLTNPPLADADNFGNAVAISGARVIVGARWDDAGDFDAGSAYVYNLAGNSPLIPVATLHNPTPEVYDSFGTSVAVSGTRAIVGAPWDGTRALEAGSAYVYDLASVTPTVPAVTLNSPSLASGDEFGITVAVSGSRVVIGAPGDDTGAQEAGSVYVYNLADAMPSRPLTLTNPRPTLDGSFGASVAISGSRVVVGVPGENAVAIAVGAAHVFDLASATPTIPTHTLTNPSPEGYQYFGNAVAISGTRVVVGAPLGYVDGANYAGTARVYDLSTATPTVPVVTLTAPSPTSGDNFGISVAISGNRVVVGASGDDTGATDAGIAYVYDLSSVSPLTPIATLINSTPAMWEIFGTTVAIDGNRVVVGAPQDDTGAWDAGIAYVYDLSSATPGTPVLVLTNPTPVLYDFYGYSVAISGTRVVVGVLNDDSDGIIAGGAYVYDLANFMPAVPVALLKNPNPGLIDSLGHSVAIDTTTIVVGAPFNDTGAWDSGGVYIFGLAPELHIVPAGPGYATISWTPATSPGFVLQYADSPASVNWRDVPGGALNPATISTTNAARFYRLFQP